MDENGFYSTDRLMEFGLGMAVATQMANSMNEGLQAMRTPGAGNALQDGIPRPGSRQVDFPAVYYAAIDGTAAGPYSLVELARLAGEGRIVKETYVWKPGMANWELAENVSEVLELIAITPPPVPAPK